VKSPVKWLSDQEYEKASARDKALAWADSFNGQKEVGKNAGPFVTKVLASVGLKPGYAWCASFVSYVFSKAGVKAGPKFNRARVKSWVDWAHREGRLYYSAPKRGDLFAWINDDLTGHIGFVLSELDFAGEFRSLEGNTNSGGSREGDGVYKRTRAKTKRMVFLRCWD
jgi:hypothetical protein